ncbi:MAG: MotA/TolQ/ExbB proton channel family protein, partial [Opitutales bacterium]|nr:MotA/TolQ/ExbB proton channel family protein [Opitutales bacterium]
VSALRRPGSEHAPRRPGSQPPAAPASHPGKHPCPGVAGALLTTVAGLVVAIPSVFGYNFLTAKSTELSTQTENFASLVADEIEMESRAIAARTDASLERASAAASTRPAPAREEPKFAPSPAPAAPRKNDIAEFSFDDDSDSPTPPRQFDE